MGGCRVDNRYTVTRGPHDWLPGLRVASLLRLIIECDAFRGLLWPPVCKSPPSKCLGVTIEAAE
jgi:hypothetical protein